MEKFAIGLLLGGLAGALLVTNNYKMRTLVRKSQEEVQAKLDKFIEEKTDELEEGVEKIKEKADQAVEKNKAKRKTESK